MKLLYRLFKQEPDTRDGIITVTSALGIAANVCIALVKLIIGLLVSSIAIISEGANNATDALSSIMTLLGAKLAKKHPDAKHPFGYGRIEYISSLVISGVILLTGVEMLLSAVKLIFHPEEMSVSYLSVAVVAGTALIKFFLGLYTIKMGHRADSGALVAVGTECRNDSFASVITVISSLLFLLLHISVDAYAGVLISLLIVKAGIDALKDTLGDILGRPGDHALASAIYREIVKTEGIVSAADMMLHNYGPEAWSGSVNVEIDHKKTVGEIYRFLHELQLRIMHEYKVTMVFGVYAVDNDHAEMQVLRKQVADFIRRYEHIRSYHALYISADEQRIYCDFMADYALRDWDGVEAAFRAYMAELYPKYDIELTIETEFV